MDEHNENFKRETENTRKYKQKSELKNKIIELKNTL